MSYQWLTLWSYGETFLAAAWLTLQVTLLAFMLAVALGLLAALAKASAAAPLRWLSHCYVEFIRNTPVLLQIFIIFFGLPSLGITMSAFTGYWHWVLTSALICRRPFAQAYSRCLKGNGRRHGF